MISPENFVYDTVSDELKLQYPGIFVSGMADGYPARFPAVTIEEADNSVYQQARTDKIENASSLMYEVNVYSNKLGYKKMEAKAIMETIDREFTKMGFTRTLCNSVPNLQDASIYRILARYEGVCDKDFTIYIK